MHPVRHGHSMSAATKSPAFSPAIVVLVNEPPGIPFAQCDELAGIGLPIILVDDGTATTNASEVFARLQRDNSEAQVTVVHCERPGGRGTLLRAGFAAAEKSGHTHALTLGPHGSHACATIDMLISAAREHRHALILGIPDAGASGPPRGGRSTRLTSILLRLETGIAVRNPHSRWRVYPLALAPLAQCRARGVLYEVEILARAAWAGCRILQVTIGNATVPGSDPLYSLSLPDKLRAAALHARLLLRRLSGWPHAKYPAGQALATPPFWRGLGQWLNPLRAWRELRRGDFGRTELASGIAVGVFIANLPVFGVQTLLALYVARRLHLHPLAVVVGSKASTPPVGPLLIAAAIWLGHLLLHGSRLTWKGLIRPMDGHVFQAMLPLLLDWIVGATLIGTGMAVITFAIASFLFRSVPARPDKVAAP
ncbi:MAG: glycosyl transferase family 2 [Phycisphaerales bacterium]|nr:glycosyl transferase family 2 [Phycisphaerales bacterium]